MVKLIMGLKGAGKTKQLVQDINNACDKASDACANVKDDIKK